MEVSATVVCVDCGMDFEISARRARELRRRQAETRCSECRRPPVVLSDAEREELTAWWLERFSRAECQQIGAALRS